MPVNIYRVTPENAKGDEHIALLCDDEWLLCSQLEALSAWLEQSTASLQPAEYVVDVGVEMPVGAAQFLNQLRCDAW